MSQPIPIIGAGIAGLTLGRCLLLRGIRFVLYDKASSKPRHNYAITLHATAYRPLLKALDIDERAFKSRVAVDAENGGAGRIGSHVSLTSHNGLYDTSSSFRANRAKLEELIREGLNVRWQHTLQGLESTPRGPRLQFDNGESCSANLVVGADGVHSTVRKSLLPSTRLNILPYIAYHGKRKMDRKTFNDIYDPEMKDSNVIESKHGNVVLNISVNERKDEEVSVSWIYSRPVNGDPDPLHRPDRLNADAQNIPEELFEEVGTLQYLPPPFSDMFDTKKLRKDRVLHWLMRKTLVPSPDLQNLLATSGVCLIGDAVHAEPIIGGLGANAAIIDALRLAETIASSERSGISNWYDARYAAWQQGAKESERSMAEIHETSNMRGSSL
ncbi:FAD/NAD(P)-binding domain-containing protein [Clathrospora elynae]|uniref:FAD/NAD(P)-binding domain-containing protein n=1 Tax=Clathrospora elynae TaxID=706981 RepID=A0A6A5SAS4_9PLEO|nr:FAD/NAD(P)-binding domain-containing protein [Clathrospora elynae]